MFTNLKKQLESLSSLLEQVHENAFVDHAFYDQKPTNIHRVLIRNWDGFVGIHIGNVLYLEADDTYTNVVTPRFCYAIELPLPVVLERLANGRLTRTHDAFAVNIDQVDSFTDWQIRIGEHALPLDGRYRYTFLKNFPYN